MENKTSEKLTLEQKLIEVKKKVDYLKKDGKGHSYSYVTPSNILGAINPLLNEFGVLLVSEILEVNVERVLSKPKGFDVFLHDKTKTTEIRDVYENLFLIKMKMTWIDVYSDEKIEVQWFCAGCNGQEQGYGSALTYGERYFLLKQFNIPNNDDDPDFFRQKNKSEEEIKKEQEEIKKKYLADLKVHVDKLSELNTADEITTHANSIGEFAKDSTFRKMASKRLKEIEPTPTPKEEKPSEEKTTKKSESNIDGFLKKENDEAVGAINLEDNKIEPAEESDSFIVDNTDTNVEEAVVDTDELDEATNKIDSFTTKPTLKAWAIPLVTKFTNAKFDAERITRFKDLVNAKISSL